MLCQILRSGVLEKETLALGGRGMIGGVCGKESGAYNSVYASPNPSRTCRHVLQGKLGGPRRPECLAIGRCAMTKALNHILFFSLILLPVVLGAEESWDTLLDRADSLSAAGWEDSALAIGQAVLERAVAEHGQTDSTVATVLFRMGVLNHHAGRYDESEILHKQALRMRQDLLGQKNLEVAASQHGLGLLYVDLGRYDEAETLLRTAIETAGAFWGQESLQMADYLSSLGFLYYLMDDYESSEKQHKMAVAIREKKLGKDDLRVATSLNDLANIYSEQGRFAEAESLYQRVLAIRVEMLEHDDPVIGRTLGNIAMLYWTGGDYIRAEQYQLRSIEVLEKTLPAEDLAVCKGYYNLALVYYDQGKYDKAEAGFQRILTVWYKNLGTKHPYVAAVENALANLCTDQGRYAEAERLLLQALATRKEVFGVRSRSVASSLNNLADLYSVQERYAEAEVLYRQALDIWRKELGPEHAEVGRGLNNLALLYKDQDEYAEAIPLLEEALAIFERSFGPSSHNVAVALKNLADAHLMSGNYARAEPLFQRALSIWRDTLETQHTELAHCLEGMGMMYEMQGDYEDAERLYHEAVEMDEALLGADHLHVAEMLEILSRFHRLHGSPEISVDESKRAFWIQQRYFRDNGAVLSESDALAYSLKTRSSASNYLSSYFNADLAEDAEAEDAADVALAVKGLVSDVIFERRRSLELGTDSRSLAIADSLWQARSRMSQIYVLGPEEDTVDSYRSQIDSLAEAAEGLESRLAMRSAPYRRMRDMKAAGAAEVLSLLPPGSALIDYLRYDYFGGEAEQSTPRYIATVLTASGEIVVRDLGEAAPLDSLVQVYRQHMLDVSSRGHIPLKEDERIYREIGRAVYQAALGPIERWVRGRDLLLVAPDGALNLVSFGGLVDDNGRYLVERARVHYLNAGRDVKRFKYTDKVGTGLLAIGDPDYNATPEERLASVKAERSAGSPDVTSMLGTVRSGCAALNEVTVGPLPHTRFEVAGVVDAWDAGDEDEAIFYLGSDASEENFKAAAPGKKVIHLATHGYFLGGGCSPDDSKARMGQATVFAGEHPLLLSGLFLAGANLHGAVAESLSCEDGTLTAYEVAAMDLRGTELVVLSACESGLGEVKQGEGVYGLRRAFQMAGARTLVCALWPLSDEAAAEMMRVLYGVSGDQLSGHLREAQLDQLEKLRSRGLSDHPWSWAGFAAVGDWR
jgi:tetratricopeptide (TPR) repeat protein/CHAT domain-containing protein